MRYGSGQFLRFLLRYPLNEEKNKGKDLFIGVIALRYLEPS